jgi:hypothetical protein
MRHKTKTSAPKATSHDLLTAVVRTKLFALGQFAHLHVRRQAEHVVIETPGPQATPDDRVPVLRLTPIGGYRFGLSFFRHQGRWQKIPVSGHLADVLAQAVAMFAPWLAPDAPTRGA